MIINTGYHSVMSLQAKKSLPIKPKNTAARLERVQSADDTLRARKITVGEKSKFVTYNWHNQKAVRIVFNDGSLLVGTFLDRKA